MKYQTISNIFIELFISKFANKKKKIQLSINFKRRDFNVKFGTNSSRLIFKVIFLINVISTR